MTCVVCDQKRFNCDCTSGEINAQARIHELEMENSELYEEIRILQDALKRAIEKTELLMNEVKNVI